MARRQRDVPADVPRIVTKDGVIVVFFNDREFRVVPTLEAAQKALADYRRAG